MGVIALRRTPLKCTAGNPVGTPTKGPLEHDRKSLGGLIAAMKDEGLCWCSGWIADPAVESSRGLQSLVDGRMRFIVAENSCLMQRLFTMLTMKFAVLA